MEKTLKYRLQLIDEFEEVVEEEVQRTYGAAQEALGRLLSHKEEQALAWASEECACGDTREFHTDGEGTCNSEARQVPCSCEQFQEKVGVKETTQRIEALAVN